MQKESSDDPDQFRPCRPITIATRASLVGVITALLLTGLALNLLVPSLTGLIPADELSRRWPWKALTTVVDGLILATLVAITPAIGWRQARFFWANIAAYLGIYYAIRLGIPPLSMQISGKESWLPVPGALMVMYLVPVLTAMGIYITSSDRTMKEFFLPLRVLFAGAGAATIGALVLIPLRVGLAAYETLAPRTVSPTTARTQHPSQYPSRYRGLVNPFRNPSAAAVQRFLVRVKEDAAGPLGPISSVHDPLIDQLREQNCWRKLPGRRPGPPRLDRVPRRRGPGPVSEKLPAVSRHQSLGRRPDGAGLSASAHQLPGAGHYRDPTGGVVLAVAHGGGRHRPAGRQHPLGFGDARLEARLRPQ